MPNYASWSDFLARAGYLFDSMGVVHAAGDLLVPELDPVRLFKCLADETRLLVTLLIQREGELCVCEMTHALEESQPKVSRHLAQLRECGLLQDRRDGQWVYYRLADSMPAWSQAILHAAERGESARLGRLQKRLQGMGNRPERRAALC